MGIKHDDVYVSYGQEHDSKCSVRDLEPNPGLEVSKLT